MYHKTDTTWLIHQGVYHPYQPAGSTVLGKPWMGKPRRSIEIPMANELTKSTWNIWVDVESTYYLGMSRCWIMLNHCMSRCWIYYFAQFLEKNIPWHPCESPTKLGDVHSQKGHLLHLVLKHLLLRKSLDRSILDFIYLSIYVNDVSLDLYKHPSKIKISDFTRQCLTGCHNVNCTR